MTYAEVYALVAGKNNRKSRKIGNNTRGYIEYDNSVSIELHSTKVVVFYPNGLVKLASGGWQTVTTKDRINYYSPVRVYQRNFEWFVKINDRELPFMEDMVVQG